MLYSEHQQTIAPNQDHLCMYTQSLVWSLTRPHSQPNVFQMVRAQMELPACIYLNKVSRAAKGGQVYIQYSTEECNLKSGFEIRGDMCGMYKYEVSGNLYVKASRIEFTIYMYNVYTCYIIT